MDSCPFNEDYFLRGEETGKSLYTSYTWKPDLTIPMSRAIIRHLGIRYDDTILDFGCARGYLVRAFREAGFMAFGCDISEWAIQHCDDVAAPYLASSVDAALNGLTYNWIIAKDVLEHVKDVVSMVSQLQEAARTGVFIVVPLSAVNGENYVVPSYERDPTHIWRWTLREWAGLFMRPGWEVTASYRVRGIKDNYYRPKWEAGNGFITVRRRE